LFPKARSNCDRIGADFLPPGAFVANAVDGAMMAAAKRHRELIADLAAERPRLHEAQMVRVGGREVVLRNGRMLRVPEGVAPSRAGALADALEGIGQ
jgi:hypothetical protein